MTTLETRTPLHRVEGRVKVSGSAQYAAEYPAEDLVYAWPVLSSVAAGRVTDVDTSTVEAMHGVLRVWWHGNAPLLVDVGMPMLAVLQSPDVHFRGEVVALVAATSPEVAREAAAHVAVTYVERGHQVVLPVDNLALRTPDVVNAGYPGVSEKGDAEAGYNGSAVRVDATYSTPGL